VDEEVVEEEEEAAAALEEVVVDDVVVVFLMEVDASSSSSSLPLDKLANFSLTSLIFGNDENLGIPGTPRFGDLPLALRSSSSSAADVVDEALDIFCIMRFSIFFSIDSSMSTSSISLANSSASRMSLSDSANAFRRLSASASFSTAFSSKNFCSSLSIWLKKSDSTDLARRSSDSRRHLSCSASIRRSSSSSSSESIEDEDEEGSAEEEEAVLVAVAAEGEEEMVDDE